MIRHIILLFFVIPVFGQQGLDSLWNPSTDDPLQKALNAISISKQMRDANLQIALSNNLSAVETLEKLERDSILAIALAELGITYSYMADYDNAFSANHRALELALSFNDTLTIIDANNNIGIDYYYLEEYDKALDYFEKVSTLARANGNSKRVANAYNNLGLVYSELGMYDKELEYYFKAREIHEVDQDKSGVAMTELNIGSVYLLESKYKEAERAFERSLALFQSVNNRSGEFDVISSIVTLKEETGEVGAAIRLAEKTLDEIKTENFIQTQKHYLELLEALYSRAGRVENAYNTLKELKELDGQIFSEQQSKVVAELETQYQTAQKEKEIAALALENERAQLLLETEENQRKILFAAIAILAMIVVFFIWRYRYKQRIASILEDKNKVISESLEQRETLLKEIHHRVKNNLQIISSLLNLQSRFISDATAVDAVKEGRDRVKSMAMIHQKLYQNDDLTGVDIRDYINNLVESLEKSYGVDPEKVKVEVSVDSLLLDIDTTIPMGLILNELISNSFKYAFPDDRKGTLAVQLHNHKEFLEMKVEDDGVGFDPNQNQETSSFGLTLIESLSEKLKAEYIVENGKGTRFNFKIHQFKLA